MGRTILDLLVVIGSVMLMLWAGVALIQDKKYFTSAPKDVQEAIQPRTERFKGAHALGWILMVCAMLLITGAVLLPTIEGIRSHWTFGTFLIRFLILLEGYKIWDIVFLDWYLLTRSHFYQHYFPEVSGCESLRKAGFNRKGQLIKLLIVFPALSVISAVICAWIAGTL